MAEVTNNGELSKSARRRAAKKARDEKYVEEAAPPPAPEPVPEKKPKAKAAATPEPKAKAKEAPKAAAKPKAKAKEEPAKPEPKAAAAKGKAAAKAAAAPEAAKPKGAAKADPKAKAGAKAPAPAPAPEPKAQAKGKAKAKAEPAPPAPAAAKAAPKPAAKQAAKAKGAPPKEEKEPENKGDRAELVQPFEMDDGTGGDWEQSTGLSKKAEKRKEKEEQRKREQAIEAAQAKKTVPGMAPTNTVPGMAPAPKAASKEEIAAFMAGVKEKGAAARAQVEAENAEKTSMHTAQIKVPENKIGIVIGPKGSKIKLIQEKTGVTRIDTSGEMFTIVGPQQAVEMAYAAVKELMEKGYCSMAFEDFKEEAVPVHPSVFPDLIGKGGVTIKAFKSELNVEITIPGDIPKTATTGTKKYKVTLAGKKDDVNKAKQVIESIVSYGYHEITHPGQTHEEIEVEPWAYKFLIGKAGSELRHIQNNYKVKVNIPREHSVCQNVVVVGGPGDVARAKDYIDNVLWKAQNQPTGRRDGDAAIDTWGQEEEEEDWMKAYIYKRK